MAYKWTLSYKTNDVTFIGLNENVQARIARVDRAFAMITFVDRSNKNQIDIPANVRLVYMR